MAKFFEYSLTTQNVDLIAQSILKYLEEQSIKAQSNPAHQKKCLYAACLNPHSFCQAQDDLDFKNALTEANWLLPDGVGVVMASRLLGIPIDRRITGWDLFIQLSEKVNATKGFRVFFLGSSNATLEKIAQRYRLDFPNIEIVGLFSPPYKKTFTAAEIDEMVKTINQAKPDILWVAMTAPKQEKWIAEVQNLINTPFAGAIGAVFDFYSGEIKRPAPIFQKLGLEWLPRLINEPQRLHQRMTHSAPKFIYSVAKAWARK